MPSFSHILVPYDAEPSAEVALKMAAKLSQRFEATITAVYVKRNEADVLSEQIGELLKEREQELNVKIQYLHPTGRMFKEVVRVIDEVDADLVIMGTHGTSGVEEFWIGSNAYRVVSSCTVPVITIQPTFKRAQFKKIVVPIDQSKETRQKIPMVAQLAHYFGSEIHLVGTTKYSDEESARTVRQYVDQSVTLLAREGIEVQTKVEVGTNIVKCTLDYAESIDADLVIMMSESEPSSGLFMGSNAQQLVNHSKIPVMTLQPVEVGIGITGY